MLRWLFNVASVLSLALLIAVVTLMVRAQRTYRGQPRRHDRRPHHLE